MSPFEYLFEEEIRPLKYYSIKVANKSIFKAAGVRDMCIKILNRVVFEWSYFFFKYVFKW